MAVLQASGGESYDDSGLRDRIDDIQWELENMDIPTTTDTSWLEDLMYNIKDGFNVSSYCVKSTF